MRGADHEEHDAAPGGPRGNDPADPADPATSRPAAPGPADGWNLFAVVLQGVLQAPSRGYPLGVIDDRTTVHREKVRRLQQSLQHAGHFPVLSPEDLALVMDQFAFTRRERLRLRAAVLATKIEAALMDRIAAEAAVQAAWEIFAIIEQALL